MSSLTRSCGTLRTLQAFACPCFNVPLPLLITLPTLPLPLPLTSAVCPCPAPVRNCPCHPALACPCPAPAPACPCPLSLPNLSPAATPPLRRACPGPAPACPAPSLPRLTRCVSGGDVWAVGLEEDGVPRQVEEQLQGSWGGKWEGSRRAEGQGRLKLERAGERESVGKRKDMRKFGNSIWYHPLTSLPSLTLAHTGPHLPTPLTCTAYRPSGSCTSLTSRLRHTNQLATPWALHVGVKCGSGGRQAQVKHVHSGAV